MGDSDSQSSTMALLNSIASRLPVTVCIFLLGSTWLLFVIYVSVGEVLLTQKDYLRFFSQMVIYHALLGLTSLAFIAGVIHRPFRPDQSLAPPHARRPDPQPSDPLHHRWSQSAVAAGVPVDDDEVPLRLLRSTLGSQHRNAAPSESHNASPQPSLSHRERKHDNDEDQNGEHEDEENHALLGKAEEDDTEHGVALMAKNGTGGLRWCRKCDGWKPDRCHHCSQCGICVLKMDHHCPWLNNCVGFHNSFVLFTTYTALLALYGASQAGREMYRFFTDIGTGYSDIEPGPHSATEMDDMDMAFPFKPVVAMLLTIMGGCFGLAVGGLAIYHWYLMLNNRTTLENLHRAVPTALLDTQTRTVLESLGPRGSRQRVPGAWRPDHILTRPERTRLRREARSINVYDLGWRNNFRQVMIGDTTTQHHTWRDVVRDLATAAWPLSRPQMKRYGAGHFFPHDTAAFDDLKAITAELRLGLEPNAETEGQSPLTGGYEVHRHTGQEWTIGDSESDSDSSEDLELDAGPYGVEDRSERPYEV